MKTSANVTPEGPSPRFLSAWFQKLAFDVLTAEQLPKSVLDFLGFFWPVRFFFPTFCCFSFDLSHIHETNTGGLVFLLVFFIDKSLAAGSQSSVIPTMHLGETVNK